jgi:hypothetical protein
MARESQRADPPRKSTAQNPRAKSSARIEKPTQMALMALLTPRAIHPRRTEIEITSAFLFGTNRSLRGAMCVTRNESATSASAVLTPHETGPSAVGVNEL